MNNAQRNFKTGAFPLLCCVFKYSVSDVALDLEQLTLAPDFTDIVINLNMTGSAQN
jgi:hypothetical protein